MNAIGKEIGYEVQWVNMGFDGLLPALQMNKVDAVIAGMHKLLKDKKLLIFQCHICLQNLSLCYSQ